jgi:hypothetical protein
MKYLRNGQHSGPLTPVWPMMQGYGKTPVGYAPSAGANGGYRPWAPTMMVFEDEPSVYSTPPRSVSPPTEAPTTPTTSVVTGGAPAPSETVEGAPPGAEVPEAAPETVHPYEETPPPEKEHPEVPATPVPSNGAAPNGEYVGGTELGPEAGYAAPGEEASRWPIYVGVGAGVSLLALLALAAFGGKKK